MSMMFCDLCEIVQDTDNDPDGFYLENHDFVCARCRDDLEAQGKLHWEPGVDWA